MSLGVAEEIDTPYITKKNRNHNNCVYETHARFEKPSRVFIHPLIFIIHTSFLFWSPSIHRFRGFIWNFVAAVSVSQQVWLRTFPLFGRVRILTTFHVLPPPDANPKTYSLLLGRPWMSATNASIESLWWKFLGVTRPLLFLNGRPPVLSRGYHLPVPWTLGHH